MEEYLQWLRESQGIDASVWSGAMSSTLPAGQVIVPGLRLDELTPDVVQRLQAPETYPLPGAPYAPPGILLLPSPEAYQVLQQEMPK